MKNLKYKIVILLFIAAAMQAHAQFGFSRIDDDPLSEDKKINFWSKPRFNRVEGLFAHGGVIINVTPSWGAKSYFHGGYGLNNNRWRYLGGIEKRFFQQHQRLLMQVNVFDQTSTQDLWNTNTIENSLAGLLLREDFCDYFACRGWMILADQKLWDQYFLRLKYSDHRYESMQTRSSFAGTLFGWKKKFRDNPAVQDGREKAVSCIVSLDWRDNPYFPRNGFYLECTLEKTFGDFNTSGLFVDGRYYFPTFGKQKFVLRAMLGMRQGSLAQQHLISIGGIGRLEGFRDHYRSGQNYAFIHALYTLGGDLTDDLPLPESIKESIAIGFFYEMGDAWYVEHVKKTLFQGFDQIQWLADAGVSFLFVDGIFRINCARQVIGGDQQWRITCRLFAPF